ncbi:MAG TPA: ATP-binding protein [Pseudolabrys sp.]|nr:ATP-binding protein [Pseudolabrys sp.]
MKRRRSIRFRLSAIFFFFFLLVIVLGFFSIGRLSDVNSVSLDIRDRWLQNTRVLGDLNNFTSDFRAAEGRHLLSSTASEVAASEMEMQELDQSISQARTSYEQIHHAAAEGDLYNLFKTAWIKYRDIVNHVLELSSTNHQTEAVSLYMTASQSAYNAASDALGRLTEKNVTETAEASSRADLAYQEGRWLISVAMLVAGVMVAGALLYVGLSISGPLLHLANGMHRLAENDTNIDVQGAERRDEIGAMARAMVVFRQNAIELMITQRRLAEQASVLEEQLANEQHLTQLQRNFVSMASHEFRTPLTIIDGHAQRLIRINDRPQINDIAERASSIRAAVMRMTNLIETLLNSSRLLDGGADLHFHPTAVDMAALLHEVCQLHREIAPEAQISEDFGAIPSQIIGDPKLLFQLFSNLVSNAIKYSPDGGEINVSTWIDSGQIAVAVKDRGIGIPEKDRERLFQRYQRGSNVSGIVGTGVGLYLVKMVIDLHCGEITTETREGEGSTFVVRLPCSPPLQNDDLSPAVSRSASNKLARDCATDVL